MLIKISKKSKMDNRFISNCTNIKLFIQCGEFMKTIVINADPKMKQEK